MPETAEAVGLSKQDIAALRLADDVYAQLHEGQHQLRAVKRATLAQRERDPYREDQRIDIAVGGTIRVYDSTDMVSGHTAISDATGIWGILRPGDRIRLVWAKGGHTSISLRGVGFVGDSLTVEVIRKKDINGRKPLRFPTAVYVGPNDSYRMCRS